jgi:hypothetical protein
MAKSDYCDFFWRSLSMAFCGSPLITSRSSLGPRFPGLRFDFGFLGILYYYHNDSCLRHWKWCPSRGSNPNARNGHTVANGACLPIPALGHK